MSENHAARFRLLTGEEPADFINRLQQLPITEASRWVGTINGLAELLDQQCKVAASLRTKASQSDG